mmetsp:Transcript_17604/g.38403  ORF Transcript_17604/g.38403 Transcript_17604/m.38403 type:complete len:236 (+) Transcript_17604:183-890(+)
MPFLSGVPPGPALRGLLCPAYSKSFVALFHIGKPAEFTQVVGRKLREAHIRRAWSVASLLCGAAPVTPPRQPFSCGPIPPLLSCACGERPSCGCGLRGGGWRIGSGLKHGLEAAARPPGRVPPRPLVRDGGHGVRKRGGGALVHRAAQPDGQNHPRGVHHHHGGLLLRGGGGDPPRPHRHHLPRHLHRLLPLHLLLLVVLLQLPLVSLLVGGSHVSERGASLRWRFFATSPPPPG